MATSFGLQLRQNLAPSGFSVLHSRHCFSDLLPARR
jgi:hypothetical protein